MKPMPPQIKIPQSFIPFDKEEIYKSIPARFEKIARNFPGKIAVRHNGKAWMYDEINQGTPISTQ